MDQQWRQKNKMINIACMLPVFMSPVSIDWLTDSDCDVIGQGIDRNGDVVLGLMT